MNLFGFTLSRRSAPDEQPVSQLSPQALAWLAGGDAPSQGVVLSNAYQQVVWVHRAINVLAEQVANIPFLFSAGPRGRENLITSGRLLDFYNHPHPHINRFQYWELRVMWLMLRGECMRVPIFWILLLFVAHFVFPALLLFVVLFVSHFVALVLDPLGAFINPPIH